MCRDGKVSGNDNHHNQLVELKESSFPANKLAISLRRETEEAIALHSSTEIRSRRIVSSRLLWLHTSKEDTTPLCASSFVLDLEQRALRYELERNAQ